MQLRFDKKLILLQNKSKDLKEQGDYRHLRFRKLITALIDDYTFLKFNDNEKNIFVGYFVKKYRLFKSHDVWIESILEAIENEKWFINNQNFWKIPYYLIDRWFGYIFKQSLSFYDSNVLLAMVIVVSKYRNSKKKPPIIQLTSKLTGFEPKTVNSSINHLKKIGAIKYSKANKYSSPVIELSDYFEKYDSRKGVQPARLIKNWGKDLVNLGDIDEFKWLGFMYALPFNSYNPFIAYVHPNIIMHQTLLNTNLLIFSLFDEDQIRSLYKIWVNSNYNRSINNRYLQAKAIFKQILDPPVAVFSSDHYKRIFRCSPILHFIAKRKRTVDLHVLYDNLYIQDALKLIHKNQLIDLIGVGEIDREYFLQCLDSGNFVEAWEEKYDIKDINPAAMFIDNVPDSIKESFTRDMGGMYEIPLQRYLNAQNNFSTLKRIRKFLENNSLNTLDSNYNCLRIKTHRITFSKYPIQSIRKQVRTVIKAPPGKVFLQVDLASAEFSILKWFIQKYQKLDSDSLAVLDLSNIADLMSIDRAIVKSMTYQFLYGASTKTICSENGLSKKVVKQFRDILLGFPGVGDFQKQAIDFARKNHISLPTALGHQCSNISVFVASFKPDISIIRLGEGARTKQR